MLKRCVCIAAAVVMAACGENDSRPSTPVIPTAPTTPSSPTPSTATPQMSVRYILGAPGSSFTLGEPLLCPGGSATCPPGRDPRSDTHGHDQHTQLHPGRGHVSRLRDPPDGRLLQRNLRCPHRHRPGRKCGRGHRTRGAASCRCLTLRRSRGSRHSHDIHVRSRHKLGRQHGSHDMVSDFPGREKDASDRRHLRHLTRELTRRTPHTV